MLKFEGTPIECILMTEDGKEFDITLMASIESGTL